MFGNIRASTGEVHYFARFTDSQKVLDPKALYRTVDLPLFPISNASEASRQGADLP